MMDSAADEFLQNQWVNQAESRIGEFIEAICSTWLRANTPSQRKKFNSQSNRHKEQDQSFCRKCKSNVKVQPLAIGPILSF